MFCKKECNFYNDGLLSKYIHYKCKNKFVYVEEYGSYSFESDNFIFGILVNNDNNIIALDLYSKEHNDIVLLDIDLNNLNLSIFEDIDKFNNKLMELSIYG